MAQIFKDPLHDRLGTWPLAYIPYGGADYGEILSIAEAVGDGDDTAFYATWTRAANRIGAEADAALAKGHRASARELLLRAACFYGKAYHPLYGKPVDPRLTASFRQQMETFNRALALRHEPVAPLRIPCEGTSLPAYLLPAEGRTKEVRPLLIVTNGYDATLTDIYFAVAVAASRRGYHCLFFDGPGQGELLFEHGVPMRPDWEVVVGAVVDFALTLPNVDPERIALSGWSLGGYLALRAASGEHRLAACIADPAQLSVANGFRPYAMKLGATPEAARNLGELDQEVIDKLDAVVRKDRVLTWSVIQRGFWVNGVDNLRDYLRSVETYTNAGRIESIRCPTLVTSAAADPVAADAEACYNALRCPKQLIRFTAEEGADGHCEMGNRSLLNRRVLDWLDEVFGAGA